MFFLRQLKSFNLPKMMPVYFYTAIIESIKNPEASKIVADRSRPGHRLFESHPSGRRLRSIRTRTSRQTNSFFASAVGLMNRARVPH